LWLVTKHGIAPDSPIIGWTLSAFTLSAALGGMTAATLSTRIAPRLLMSITLGLAPIPLYMLFALKPNTLPYYMVIMMAGALAQASLPLLIVSVQNLAPHAMATASGMAMGFSSGVAGLLYIAVGYLQETIGLVPAMQLSYLAALPAAVLVFWLVDSAPVLPKATSAPCRPR